MVRRTLSEEEVAKLRQIDAYDHKDKKRYNNPPAEMARYDKDKGEVKQYAYDPNIDPSLQWAGKAEHEILNIPTTSIHIHESIKPSKILKDVETIGKDTRDVQPTLFGETPLERMKRRQQALEFYKHGVDWTNRLIAGDSLLVMNSLLQKEGMAGQVQMVYIDPPYGIKYGSNFQPFVNKTSVTDKKDSDMDSTPEQITAFRDTWELGIHSYLTYLRDRILLAHELLSDSGSLFVQISDTNVHHVREICDEIFGADNFASQIFFQKTANAGSSSNLRTIASVGDYIVWYAKNIKLIKYHELFKEKVLGGDGATHYNNIKLANGKSYSINQWEKLTGKDFSYNNRPIGSRVYTLQSLTSQSGNEKGRFPVTFKGKVYRINHGSWKTSKNGMLRLIKNGRIYKSHSTIRYIRYFDDFPLVELNNAWMDIGGIQSRKDPKIYAVQTATEAIKRCMLMSTDPGDLVLDPTCGSGTTAYVAEQWGRRWITIDTSRVAIELAKQRLMTATFDYYQLAHPDIGVDSGFQYNTAQHIQLKDIANNLKPVPIILYDSPKIDKTKVRISGPFTVEAIPAPTVQSLGSDEHVESNIVDEQDYWQKELLASGIWGRNNKRIEFSRIEKLTGTHYIQAMAETKGSPSQRAAICFGSTEMPLDARAVSNALDEAQNLRPSPQLIVFAAFQFDPEAKTEIENTEWPGVTLLKVQMNDDLSVEDLKKKRSSDQSFMLIGEPDVDLVADGRSKNRYKVQVKGWDYYNVARGEIDSGSPDRIAMWMLDTDYDGMCIEPMQVFFPMGGRNGGWHRLAKTLQAEINQPAIEKYAGTESLWFTAKPGQKVAVKIVDDRGIESMKVLTVGDEN